MPWLFWFPSKSNSQDFLLGFCKIFGFHDKSEGVPWEMMIYLKKTETPQKCSNLQYWDDLWNYTSWGERSEQEEKKEDAGDGERACIRKTFARTSMLELYLLVHISVSTRTVAWELCWFKHQWRQQPSRKGGGRKMRWGCRKKFHSLF